MSWLNRAIYATAASLFLFLTANTNSQTGNAGSPSVKTTPLFGNMRPLYVFTPSISDLRAATQLSALHENKTEADERQVVIVLEDQSQTLATLPEHPKLRLTSPDSDQTAARRRFKVSPSDFTVILAGKDGREKLRSHQPIPFSRLRDTIDRMPMRQQEMHQKN